MAASFDKVGGGNTEMALEQPDLEAAAAFKKDKDISVSDSYAEFVAEPEITRSGTALTAFFLVITAVIGAGVLSLPYSVAMLGWPGGIVCLIVFSWITLYTSWLLTDVNIVKGKRMRCYTEAVEKVLGRWQYIAIAWLQQVNLVLTALAYSITATLSLQTLAQTLCSTGSTHCFDKFWHWACIFGAIQLFCCFLPDMDTAWWPSVLGAIMSFCYSSIALGRAIAEGNTHGTSRGIMNVTTSEKTFGVFNSLGAILFAYSFSMILPEIQDTISDKVKGGPILAMKKTVAWSVGIMTAFYMAVAISGYMAYGDAVAGNILDSFTDPKWVVDMANIMVIIHLIPAYQVWSQPHFYYLESNMKRWWPNHPAMFKGWTFRLWFRPLYVLIVTFLTICMPFFSYIIGFVGAIGFWPTTVYFPIAMWVKMFKPSERKIFWLQALNWFCAIVTVFALVGAVQSIVVAWTSFCFFC